MEKDTTPDTSDLFMAFSQELVWRANDVLQEYLRLNETKKDKGVGVFPDNHLSECAHAFLEALTKQTKMILVCNELDLFYP